MSVSVIIPAYNAEKYLRATLETIAAQTHRDFECIVVDDGSTDRTWQIAQQFAESDPRFRVFRRNNGGLPAARNSGISESDASRPFITFLDSDDLWQPLFLEALMNALMDDDNAVATYCLGSFVDSQGCPTRTGELERALLERRAIRGGRVCDINIEEPTDFGVLLYRNVICTAGSVLVRRNAVAAINGFDESIWGCDDYDFWLRLSTMGNLTLVPKALMHYRQHASSMSTDTERMNCWKRRVLWKILSDSTYTLQHRTELELRDWALAADEQQMRLRWAGEAGAQGALVESAKQRRHAMRLRKRMRRYMPESPEDIQILG